MTNKASGETKELPFDQYMKEYKNYPKEEWEVLEQIKTEPAIPATKVSEFSVMSPDGFDLAEDAAVTHLIGTGPAGLASLPTDSCATVVVEGSIPYLDQLALLTETARILSAAGQLVLFGEYLDDGLLYDYLCLIWILESGSPWSTSHGRVDLVCLDGRCKWICHCTPLQNIQGQGMAEGNSHHGTGIPGTLLRSFFHP